MMHLGHRSSEASIPPDSPDMVTGKMDRVGERRDRRRAHRRHHRPIHPPVSSKASGLLWQPPIEARDSSPLVRLILWCV